MSARDLFQYSIDEFNRRNYDTITTLHALRIELLNKTERTDEDWATIDCINETFFDLFGLMSSVAGEWETIRRGIKP